jgi:hypothetical protein
MPMILPFMSLFLQCPAQARAFLVSSAGARVLIALRRRAFVVSRTGGHAPP